MDLKLSDFRSSVYYEGYGIKQLHAFNPQKYPDEGEQHRRLDFFLENIVPSKFNWPEAVEEIRILSPSYEEGEELGDTESLRDDWRELKLTPNRINFHTVKELAVAHKCLRGTWILFYKPCEREKQDVEWVKVARATAKGELGMFAKVSDKKWDNNYSTCVYTKNFTNKKEVLDMEEQIRHLGVKGQMAFKPSVYSILGLFAVNEWSLKVGIYTSHWDPVRNISVIEDKTK